MMYLEYRMNTYLLFYIDYIVEIHITFHINTLEMIACNQKEKISYVRA